LLAKVQVDNVLEGLESADPNGAATFRSNAEGLKARLDSLHQEFRVGLSNRTKDDIITTHEGFNYLAERYGFTAHAALGISGDEQPSVQDMAGLVELMEELDLRYVFVDPAFSDQYMGTISRETGAELLVLDGLHGRMGIHSDLDYFDIMYENLKNLKEGLEVVGASPL
jgi:zinc transport system substrate-binding protein